MRFFLNILLFIILFTTILPINGEGVQAQSKIKVGWISHNSQDEKIFDLTPLAERECTQTRTEKAGRTFVEIKFQPQNEQKAADLLKKAKQLTEKTQKNFPSLLIDGVRIYLLQLADPPSNYKILVPKQDDLFIYLKIFSSDDQVDLKCADNWFFCDEFYRVIPHEFIHPALKDIVRDARWFEEGVAEYAGFEAAKQTEPAIITRAREIYVQSSLNKPGITDKLLKWKELTLSKIDSGKISIQDVDFYSASQQLIRTIIAESQRAGVQDPLNVLLEKLKKFRKEKGSPANTKDILSLIKTELKVEVRKLNKFDANLQKSLVDEAANILLRQNPDRQTKLYAITTLNNIDQIPLTDDVLKKLLQITFSPDEDILIKRLSATALISRINQAGFDVLIEKFSSANFFLNKKSLKQIKTEIRKISEN